MTFGARDSIATQTRVNERRFGCGAQAAHWLTAILAGLVWGLGLINDELLTNRISAIRGLFHEIAGETIFALLFLRLVLRLVRTQQPPIAHGLARAASALVNTALYLLLFAVPVTGLTALFAGGEAISVFGILEIASPWAANREMQRYAGDIHDALANTLLLVASLHAFAALVGHFVFKNGALRRMLPPGNNR